jgi:hypothetical protein
LPFCAKKFTPKQTVCRFVNTCFFGILGIILLGNCKDPKAKIPSYIHIQSFEFSTNRTTQGVPSSEILDAHVFVNGKLWGVYELPATIPILVEGNSNIVIFPGIKEYKDKISRQVIRTLEPFDTIIVLTPTKIDTIQPFTRYKSNVEFVWIEDYDNGVYSTAASDKNSTQDSIIIIDSLHPNAYKGNGSKYSAMIKINPTAEFVYFEHLSRERWVLPRMGRDVYLEVDYMTNIPLQFGIWADRPDFREQIPFAVFLPNTKWNKVYMNLSLETSGLPPNSPAQIFFGFVKSANDSTSSPEVYIDNIKLTYLK